MIRRRIVLLTCVAIGVTSCDLAATLGIEPRCLNDRIPYSAMPDTITLVHCSTVDSIALHHDTTRAKP